MNQKQTAQNGRHAAKHDRAIPSCQTGANAALGPSGSATGAHSFDAAPALRPLTGRRRVQQQQGGTDAMPDDYTEWLQANPLAVWRGTRGYSQAQVAMLLNVSTNSIRAWERGLGEPSPASKLRIANVTREVITAQEWAEWYAKKPTPTVA